MQNTTSELDQFPYLETYIERESALELARRSLLGAPVYTIISLIMLAGTPMLKDYRGWAVAEVILLVLLGVVRVWFALGFEQRYDRIGERAVNQFSAMTALHSLTLGVLSAMVIWQYWEVSEVVLTIVLSAGCIAAGTSAMSVRRSAQLIFLICILVPFGVSVFLVGGLARALFIVGFLSLMAFLVQDGGQAKRAYIKSLKEHYGEKIFRRRAALELQAKRQFVNEIGLDVRAPVNSIIGMTALLLDERLSVKSRELAESIRKSADALWRLVADMPGALRTAHDAPGSRLGVLNLKSCISNTMNLYRLEAMDKGLVLSIDLEGIPENVTSCDQSQLEQVLANLMARAMQQTDKGSITLSASCEGLQNGTMLIEFSLADTGTDIPPENREAIFNPFRGKGTHTGKDSSDDGLGLPVCKGLVELMGGDIWIEGNHPQGSTVKFTIRAELDPSENTRADIADVRLPSADTIVRPFAAVTETLSELYPHNILVVDDDDIHRQIVCVQLQKLGYAADEAADGEQAIAAVMEGQYDLIFMDLRLPNMSGIESTRWIRERFNDKGLQIVALTGDATIKAMASCMQAGMDSFVTKPVQIKDLKAVLCHTRHDQIKTVGTAAP